MADTRLIDSYARYWWTFALRGILLIAFGLLAVLWPGLTLAVLILLFGLFALADGAFALVLGFSSGAQGIRGWLVLMSILAIGAGMIALVWPGLTAVALLFLVAAWALVRGVFEIVSAIRLRREIEHEWLLALSGAVLVLLGALLFLFPAAGLLSVVWLMGAFALVAGVLLLIGAFRLRRLPQRFAAATD
jgi:uncharacterized membrane protein HdeD (DUF308 family)